MRCGANIEGKYGAAKNILRAVQRSDAIGEPWKICVSKLLAVSVLSARPD